MAQKQVYGPDIFDAIASGDLRAMKQAAGRAQQYLEEHGDVGAALMALKVEIAKAEASGVGKQDADDRRS